MTEEKFEDLWDNNIYTFAISLQKEHDGYINFNSDRKIEIWKKYEQYKENYKKYANFTSNHKIDRHKIASLLTLATIDSHILDVEKNSNVKRPAEVYLANVRLAFESALSILWSYVIQEQKNNNSLNTNHIDLFKDHEIKYPSTTREETATYLDTLLRVFFCYQIRNQITTDSQIHSKPTNELCSILPHVYFFLESFNRELIIKKQIEYIQS